MKDFNITPFTPEVQSSRPCRSLLRIRKKKYKKIRQCHQKKGNRKMGMWNLIQTIKYISFIKDNFQKFENEDSRRKERVFSMMAQHIRSRSAIQCRSHHQKMVQTYGQPSSIISHYQNKVIPYYQARTKQWLKEEKPASPPSSFCMITLIDSCVRLEINADMVQCY